MCGTAFRQIPDAYGSSTKLADAGPGCAVSSVRLFNQLNAPRLGHMRASAQRSHAGVRA